MFLRRQLLKTSALFAVALLCPRNSEAWFPHGLRTTFYQGELAGGGYLLNIPIADDGTKFVNYDSGNAWRLDTKWKNILNQSALPAAYSAWGQGSFNLPISPNAQHGLDVCATNSSRVWIVITTPNGFRVLRSDDKGVSWIDTGLTVNGDLYVRQVGPRVACDPFNGDTCYISDAAGIIYRTQDAGATWTILNASGQPLSGVLSSAATSAPASSGTTVSFGSVPANVQTIPSGFTVYATDITTSAANKGSLPAVGFVSNAPAAAHVSSSTATTVTFSVGVQNPPGVGSGDVFLFGAAACIVFDRSGGQDINGRCKNIYIGWSYGATAVYASTDAGSGFTPLNTGTFPNLIARLECSRDGVLYAIDFITGVNYSTTTCWKYASGVWSSIAVLVGGNPWAGVASDPNNAGVVCLISLQGGLQISPDYGAHWSTRTNNLSTRTATDVPWMGPSGTNETNGSTGSIKFDPSVNGQLWYAEGIGVWKCTPIYNGSGVAATYSWVSINSGEQGLIVNNIVKPSGQPLFVTVFDRAAFSLSSTTQEPNAQVGGNAIGAINYGSGADYAKNDLTFLAMIIDGQIWSNGSGSWSALATQPSVSSFGGQLCVQSSLSMVWFPGNEATPTYWNGTTWQLCLFNGSSLATGWSFTYTLNRNIAFADPNNIATYWAFNYNNDATGGIWKSVDGGATWTNVTAIGTLSAIYAGITTVGKSPVLIGVPGFSGHLFLATGSGFTGGVLLRTIDGGATWHAVPGATHAWQVAVGKAKPGASYLAVFFTGLSTISLDYGVFRADDVSSTDTSLTPSWIQISKAPAENMGIPRYICADPDIHGTCYIAAGAMGYTVGQL